MTFTPPPSDLPAIIRQMKLQLEESNRRRLVRAQTFEVIPASNFPIPFGASFTDIPGGSIPLTTVRDNAVAVVTCCFDWLLTVTGTGWCFGTFAVDGTSQGTQAIFAAPTATARVPGSYTKRVVLSTAGDHTINLQGRKELNAGTASFTGSNVTSLQVTLYD